MISEDMSGRPTPTPMGQELLEQRVIDLIIEQAADKPYARILGARLASRKLVKRQLSGVGFFLEFEVDRAHSLPEELSSPIPEEALIGEEGSDILGGCIYFWSRDYTEPDMLEGFTYFGNWPSDVSFLKVSAPLAGYVQ